MMGHKGVKMKALAELCDVLADNEAVSSEGIALLSSQCPSLESFSQEGLHPTVRQLNGLLGAARYLSRAKKPENRKEFLAVILEFITAVPNISRAEAWPASFTREAFDAYYSELIVYLAQIALRWHETLSDVSNVFADLILNITEEKDEISGEPVRWTQYPAIKSLLAAMAVQYPALDALEADAVANCLLENWLFVPQSPPESSGRSSSAQSSPLRYFSPTYNGHSRSMKESRIGQGYMSDGHPSIDDSPRYRVNTFFTPDSTPRGTLTGESEVVTGSFLNMNGYGNAGHSSGNAGNYGGNKRSQQLLMALEGESTEALERQDIAFRLFVRILEKADLQGELITHLRTMAMGQLGALLPLLKIRKREWPVDGVPLLAKMNIKLQASQSAAVIITRLLRAESDGSPLRVPVDGRLSRGPIRETLSLLMDAADACMASPWRRLKSCESLFETLLSGVAQMGGLQGNQLLRILLLRVKSLVLATCAQTVTSSTNQGPAFASVAKAACGLIEAGWNSDRAAIESFLLSLAVYVRECLEHEKKERQVAAVTQLNVIPFLADLAVMMNKAEAVEIIIPLFVESLEEGDASVPSLVRLRVLEAVARMACLGCQKSYRELVVLLTVGYIKKLDVVGSSESRTLAPETTTERLETLPGAFLHIARGLKEPKLRSDFLQRMLMLCSDVGLVAESKIGRSGADFLGPLLPALAEICSDLEPLEDVDSSMLKLFRNLWFYIVLFGLAPPIQKVHQQPITYPRSVSSGSQGNLSVMQTVAGPYVWNVEWSTAVNRLTQSTPPLVVNSVKWLEDEVELIALHNPGSKRGSGNERAAVAQRTLLSATLGGRVDIGSLSTVSGVKATYLLAVAFLEILRLSYRGGVFQKDGTDGEQISALTCAFKYLETPNLPSDLYQCLTAIVHRAFDAALTWLEEKAATSGKEVEEKERVLTTHACFLIKHETHREEAVRELADSLLSQLRNKFPQVLWNGVCLEALLQLLSEQPTPLGITDGGSFVASRHLIHQRVKEWLTHALLLAPSTTQGLLQEYFRQVGTWQKVAHSSDIIALLSEIRLDTSNLNTATVPALTAAAAAAAGGDMGSMEMLSIGLTSANVKSKYAGEIAGMKRLFGGSLGGLSLSEKPAVQFGVEGSKLTNDSGFLHGLLINRFVQQIQQFVTDAQHGLPVDGENFREACLQAAALLLSDLEGCKGGLPEGASQLLRLLCWCPAHIFTARVMETGVFVWTWLIAAAPLLASLVLAELVDAWLWTATSHRGIFAAGVDNSGPASQMRPQLVAGIPKPRPAQDPLEGITAHRIWLGFLLDRFEVVRHTGSDQLLLIARMMQGSMEKPSHFSSHPAAAGGFFTLLLLGLRLCDCLLQTGIRTGTFGVNLLRDRVYRAAFAWFSVEPGWFESSTERIAQAEAQAFSSFAQALALDRPEGANQVDPYPSKRTSRSGPQLPPSTYMQLQTDYHPVWGKVDDAASRERRKQLLILLCQHEADRLETWAHPLRENLQLRYRSSSERWADHVKTAWAVDPRIALALVARFPGAVSLKAEVFSMVQACIPQLTNVPEALPYLVTPKAVEEDSTSLHWLPHWAPCSITRALEFLTPPYKGHPRVMAYVLRVMESYPPERVTFFMPQLVQALRYDHGGLVEGYLMVAARKSNLFAHILIWQLQGEEAPPSDEVPKESVNVKGNTLYEIVPKVRRRIIDSFTAEAFTIFDQEFRFFDKVTSISGVLYPLPKDARRAGIRRELEKIHVEGDQLYLPTAPSKLVKGIEVDSGIPLQSAAKVPIMITFDVVDKNGSPDDIKLQACIFKVGDDCRQDVLALQVIALLKNIWEAVGVNLYLFPYGVLPTGYGRGIIEVVPNTRSRNQMGEITDGGLYELYQQEYGPVGSVGFEKARDNFIVSSAGYAVASLLLQPKDRHNGNLLFDNEGRLVHIDFGFILETSPGGNMRFESAQFKLSHEMTQLLDPSGVMKSETWNRFVSLSVKGYLTARSHMDGIINTVLLMVDSGLPCFSRGDPIGNLRKRFHPEMSEREAANFMIKTCADAYNKWSTAGYDLIQYLQQGIER